MAKKRSRGSGKSRKGCKGWCTPAKVYVGLAVLSTMLSLFVFNKFDQLDGGNNLALLSVGHVATTVFWTAVLYWLCKKCYHKTAWAVLLLPYIIALFLLLTSEMSIIEGFASTNWFVLIISLLGVSLLIAIAGEYGI